MSIPSGSPTARAGAAITLVATLISIYIVSQFLRNSIGVIAPNLAQELGLSAGEIGLLSSAFFFVFAAVQIPVGAALARGTSPPPDVPLSVVLSPKALTHAASTSSSNSSWFFPSFMANRAASFRRSLIAARFLHSSVVLTPPSRATTVTVALKEFRVGRTSKVILKSAAKGSNLHREHKTPATFFPDRR